MANPTGAPKRGMRDYVLNLDGVNEQHIDAEGDYFHIQSVSVGGTNVLLRFDDGPAITRQQGEGNRVYYSRVSVSASAACQVTVQLGYGYATDSRATVNATITAPITPALHNPAQPAVSVAATTQTLLIAADPNRIEALIKIPSTASNGLWIGDNTAAVNEGLYHEPGETISYATQAALYGYNPGAAAVLATILAMEKV